MYIDCFLIYKWLAKEHKAFVLYTNCLRRWICCESDFKGKAQIQYKNNAALHRAHSNNLIIEFINPNISIY